jgi:hypothetical protein
MVLGAKFVVGSVLALYALLYFGWFGPWIRVIGELELFPRVLLVVFHFCLAVFVVSFSLLAFTVQRDHPSSAKVQVLFP